MCRRNVIWITIESFRYDYTSFSSASKGTTPTLERLARTGTAFNDCHAHSIWTRPSSASILTGYPPSAHQTWSNNAKLPETIYTLPEAFSQAGYHTACVSPIAQLSSATGLDRGFDSFHYLRKSTLREEAGIPTLVRWLPKLRRHSGGLTTDGRQHCTSYFINQIAKRHIRDTDDQPLFLYLHYGDSHHPYIPPVTWRQRVEDELSLPLSDAVELALEMSERLMEKTAQSDPFSDDEWQTLKTLYGTSLAYVDQMIGELLSFASSHLDDPIVVVTGDHGELFGEAGLLAHSLVTHTALTNVPLIVKNIDGLSSGGLIQHADVMQMICNTLGIDHPVPAGKDIREATRRYAVSQRSGEQARQKLPVIQEYNDNFPAKQFHHEDLTSLRTADWRYQRSADGHDLFKLPDETTDVSGEYPEKVAEFEARYESWMSEVGAPAGTAQTAQFTTGMKEQLRDLGYL